MSADQIILKGMQFYGFHGVNAEERTMGQPYLVDMTVELDLSVPGLSDRLEDTVSYTHLYRVVKDIMEGESKNLLEATAQSIAKRVLDEFPVLAVQLRVQKLRPPIRGSVIDYAAVDIYRSRD